MKKWWRKGAPSRASTRKKTRIGAGDADLGAIARVAVEFAESGVIDVAGTA
jgi:hypothetical protein